MKARKKKKKPESYCRREYRRLVSESGLVSSKVRIEETDLHILAEGDVTEEARDLVLKYRTQLESYIVKNPQFCATLDPMPVDKIAPPLVRDMLVAGIQAGVGPMAAVAGAVAEYVGRGLIASGYREVMVENGGDIFLQRERDCLVAIFAGQSPLSYKVGLRLSGAQMPMGICTSSGTVGHSLSLGEADSVTVLSRSTPLADAVATRLGNEVGGVRGGRDGVQEALEKAKMFSDIDGVVVICGEFMGAAGDVELVETGLQEG
ncbi:MAG: UPF0280 family protein [Thermodesulfobacteriota bacterium]